MKKLLIAALVLFFSAGICSANELSDWLRGIQGSSLSDEEKNNIYNAAEVGEYYQIIESSGGDEEEKQRLVDLTGRLIDALDRIVAENSQKQAVGETAVPVPAADGNAVGAAAVPVEGAVTEEAAEPEIQGSEITAALITATESSQNIEEITNLALADKSYNGRISPDALAAALLANDSMEVAKKLIDLGVDVNGSTSFGFTPLMAAVQGSRGDMAERIRFLIESGADVNTKMHCQGFKGQAADTSGIFADGKAVVSECRIPQISALSLAILEKKDNGEIALLLTEKGALVDKTEYVDRDGKDVFAEKASAEDAALGGWQRKLAILELSGVYAKDENGQYHFN